MIIILLFITGALLIITLTMALNLLTFPKLKPDSPTEKPFVSILIPARNEAHIIGKTVDNLLKQNYSNFEVIVLDDNSEDGTGDIARKAGKDDSRLQVISGEPLPENWMGKSWACHNLAQEAKGDILIFTDADVQWQAGALEAAISQMQHSKVDMLTVWPTQITETMPERLTVPLMALVILGYLPVFMVHHSTLSIFAAANGQCMAWRRDAYFAIEGHQAVANNVLDDVTLARLAKKKGFRIRMTDGAGFIQTRMYSNWATVRDGFAKNILAGYGNGVFGLLIGTIFHWLIFIFPYVALFFPQYRLWGLLLILLGITLRITSALFTKQRIIDALLMPASVVLMTIIATQSIYWHLSGKTAWKGRKLKEKDKQKWKPPSSSAAASAD